MRHRVQQSRLNRQNSHRKATVKSLVQHLLSRNRIQTTLPKAQVASRLADRLITLGKQGDIPSQRLAFQYLQNRGLVHRLVHVLVPLFKSRQGGYTRIIKLIPRRGDAAPMALLEWVEFPLEEVGQKSSASEEKEKKSTPEVSGAAQVKKEEKKPSFLKGLKRFLRQPA